MRVSVGVQPKDKISKGHLPNEKPVPTSNLEPQSVSVHNVEDTILVNLSEYFLASKNYMFPPQFQGLEFKPALIMMLKMASIKTGFILSTMSSKSSTSMAKSGTFQSYTTMCCQQHRMYKKNPINNKKEQEKLSSCQQKITTDRRTCTVRTICFFLFL